MDQVVMWVGFALASYSVVGNDVIQTLGTFIASNEKKKWYTLWAFAALILIATLVYSWYMYDGDVSFHRLIGDESEGYSLDNPKYPLPSPMQWYYILPPLVLLFITRWGIPVSTSFLILTFFKPKGLDSMLIKSVSGYAVALIAALVIYWVISKAIEQRFLQQKMTKERERLWSALQWLSTGFLWTQWLAQDFANIYVYLPRRLGATELVISMLILVVLLGYVFYQKGGKIQEVIDSKTNTHDIRSATIIDFIYGIVLFFFKELNNVPMSTTWVFIGLLAGREIAIRNRVFNEMKFKHIKPIALDLLKVTLGLIISIGLVYFIRSVGGN
ncbi:hypothetical protein OAH12_00500 [Cyclobacteriaceae bacterium]|nr:hypothetical protein [Cyclobacteriaceae bacterium]